MRAKLPGLKDVIAARRAVGAACALGISLGALLVPGGSLVGVAQGAECPGTVPADSHQVASQALSSDAYRHAHRFADGTGVTVAVIDTGVEAHPRLKLHPDNEAGDCQAHGTIVAGVIAAHDNGDGVVGVAPGAEILGIRQAGDQRREDTAGTIATLVEAIDTAIERDVDVINISVVACVPQDQSLEHTPLDQVIKKAEARGIVMVAAAGNLGGPCTEHSQALPAAHPLVVGVGATSDERTLAAYSMPVQGGALSAPGQVLAAIDPRSSGLASATTSYNSTAAFEGTSFAAPLISGTFALLRQRYPEASPAALRAMLYHSVDPNTGVVDPLRSLTFRHEPAQQHQIHLAARSPVVTQGWNKLLLLLLGFGLLGIVLVALRGTERRHEN